MKLIQNESNNLLLIDLIITEMILKEKCTVIIPLVTFNAFTGYLNKAIKTYSTKSEVRITFNSSTNKVTWTADRDINLTEDFSSNKGLITDLLEIIEAFSDGYTIIKVLESTKFESILFIKKLR